MAELKSAIIFYGMAEYCDYASKMTIKHRGNKIRFEMWDSANDEISVETKTFWSRKKAWRAYRLAIGNAVIGGWKVLNALPERETWETKRSK